MIDWTISVGTIAQIVGFLGTALIFVFSLKNKVDKFEEKVGDIKAELKELRKVFTTQVDHDGRLSRNEKDISDLRTDIKELRHGEGFIFPLKPIS